MEKNGANGVVAGAERLETVEQPGPHEGGSRRNLEVGSCVTW